jgi:hypothetical protein
MKKIIFTGCSFTQAPDSWAHISNPWIYDDTHNKHDIEKQNNSYTHIEFSRTDQTLIHLKDMYFSRCQAYGEEKSQNFDPTTILRRVAKLPKLKYQLHIMGSGANSNVDNVRRVIHFIENNVEDINAIIFQITADNRYNKLHDSDSEQAINNGWYKDRFLFTAYDDIYFEKITEYANEEYMVHSIEALQNLTTFSKAHNITLKYFHGWDNFDYDNRSEYIKKKYNTYVLPNLLTETTIIDYAKHILHPNDVFQYNDLHPSTLAHRMFWNDIVYPFCANLR